MAGVAALGAAAVLASAASTYAGPITVSGSYRVSYVADVATARRSRIS
jgi:hypothetical protein